LFENSSGAVVKAIDLLLGDQGPTAVESCGGGEMGQMIVMISS